ncbi:MAG: fatty acid desaturase [Rhizobiaceae bacterium]|nr:fatty acid desaturase [Hyphomicrobiales bacterium]NRB32765.1 fatty acid desaturase [Rhizobiaceae bacterium]
MQQASSGNNYAPMSSREPKRWLWCSSLVLIAVSVLAYVSFVSSPENPIYLAVPAVAIFVVLPAADWWIGEDPTNLSDEIEGELASDPFYQLVAYFLIAGHYGFFVLTVWIVANHSIPIWALAVLLIGTATINGNAINIGHELGHKADATNRFMTKVALALSGYGHFTIEHNRGHHVLVATPEDCASACMGENVYAFALRELPGALIGGWSQECRRLAAKGLPVIHWRNEILQVYVTTLLMTALLVFYFGWSVLPFIVLHHFLSWYALTQINYIKHYGLLRQK